MLQIFFISDHSGEQCQPIIEQCWEQICRNTINTANEQNRAPLEALSDKIQELGRRFYPEESVFPLTFLISKLETYSFEAVESGRPGLAGWVVRTMIEIQVPYSQLFHVYHNIFESRVLLS